MAHYYNNLFLVLEKYINKEIYLVENNNLNYYNVIHNSLTNNNLTKSKIDKKV